jgi:bacterioferritin (cytochrome b1)
MPDLSDTFFAATAYTPQKPEISAFEQLMTRFAAHESEELVFLRGYQDIVDRHGNPLVRFLLQLIMADEEKHHAMIHAMTATLNEGLTGRESTDRVPKLGKISAEERESLLRLTAEFIRTEKTGIKEYKDLIKASKGYYKGVLVLLLQTIIHDSQKHVMILEFIDSKLREG